MKCEKKYFQKFSFVRPANEKRRKSAGFQDFSDFSFLHGQLLPLYSISGLTLIKKAQKRQNIAVGPEGNYHDSNPG